MEEIRQGMDHEDAGQRPSSSHLPRKQEMLLDQRVREIEGEGEYSCEVGDKVTGFSSLTGATLTKKKFVENIDKAYYRRVVRLL